MYEPTTFIVVIIFKSYELKSKAIRDGRPRLAIVLLPSHQRWHGRRRHNYVGTTGMVAVGTTTLAKRHLANVGPTCNLKFLQKK